jgi:hypothetical protein
MGKVGKGNQPQRRLTLLPGIGRNLTAKNAKGAKKTEFTTEARVVRKNRHSPLDVLRTNG